MNISLKKVVWIIILCLLVLGTMSALFQMRRGKNVELALASTRKMLRQQGFKTDLVDFNFHTDAAMRAREAALTVFGSTVHQAKSEESIELMPSASEDAVIVVWKQDWLKAGSETFHWPDLSDALDANRLILDDACTAALSSPIRFNLEASHGAAMLLKHLAPLKHLSQSLNSRMLLELHDGHPDVAWTNLLAATRLVTAWEPEPSAVSHQVRFALTSPAFAATWQALQAHQFSDTRLEHLQTEWQSVNFFTNLPATAAFQRAYAVDLCQRERREPIASVYSWSDFFKEIFKSPRSAWGNLKFYKNLVRYRLHDSYVDENNLLLFYRDRENELHAAASATNWLEMQTMPGVVAKATFTSPYHSRWQTMMNMRETSVAYISRGRSFLGLAAEAEARRGIILTALGLERYRLNHGSYPTNLEELSKTFQKSAPTDFMNGRPLHYRLADDGNFILYSVGLDGADDGGTLPMRNEDMFGGRMLGTMTAPISGDIVWPRPASDAAAKKLHQSEEQAEARKQKIEQAEFFNAEWMQSLVRQARTNEILAMNWTPGGGDMAADAKKVSETLRNKQTTGTNELSLDEILKLKQVITGGEPEDMTFEVPVRYEVITNGAELTLLVDASTEDALSNDTGGRQQELKPAANGNCLIVWHTIYDPPGQHAVQLRYGACPEEPWAFVCKGRALAVTTTNLCQFGLDSATYDTEHGATFHARLPETNGVYTIECLTTNGDHLATLTGSTTNGEFETVWDLMDKHGHRLNGETFNSVIHLTLPDSGRTQTLRGP